MEAKTVKMFGLQRTGTNVVLKGLKANFYIRSVEHGREWKHGPVKKSGEEVQCLVFCFREPFAWLASMYRFSFTGAGGGCPHFRRSWSFSKFLRSPHYQWDTPLDRWNEMNRHYLDWIAAHPDRGIAVRCEDMLSPEQAAQQYLRIGQHFGLARLSSVVHTFRRRITPTQRIAKRPMNFDYYRERRYLAMYSAQELAEVRARVDPEVVARLGYQPFLELADIPATPAKPAGQGRGGQGQGQGQSGDGQGHGGHGQGQGGQSQEKHGADAPGAPPEGRDAGQEPASRPRGSPPDASGGPPGPASDRGPQSDGPGQSNRAH
jgi:hypothetical protein